MKFARINAMNSFSPEIRPTSAVRVRSTAERKDW